jgi:DNA polymerase III subunit gamma/tau
MSYEGLARKWRPKSFDEVVGQEPVVATLSRALESERVSQALLFTGSRGVGKTTLARLMAKAISCEQGMGPAPCGECRHCVEISSGASVDIVEIDGASHTGVDHVRELRESARYQPQSTRRKIFIIDEVHMLSTGAFNALLKILEEPPPHIQFIFATTEPHKIPVTILSRCQRYDFRRIRTSVIVKRLTEILTKEGISIQDAGLETIARAADGGMRDALSLTDQVLSFAGESAEVADVIEALGLIDRGTILEATFSILDRDHKKALELITQAYERGHALRQLMQLVTEEIRNLTLSAMLGTIAGFADLTDDDAARIDARAKTSDAKDLQRLFQQALDGIDLVARAADPRLALELVFIRLCDRPPVSDAVAISEALVRLDALMRGKQVPSLTESAFAEGSPVKSIVDKSLSPKNETRATTSGDEPVRGFKKKKAK